MNKKAVFLDRDGVLNKTFGRRPPNNADELHLLPGAAEAVKDLYQAGFKIFVVTNQGGVGLGYMTKKQLNDIHEKLQQQIAASGGQIDDVAACTHKPKKGCKCRKPKPGLILELADKHQINRSASYMIGDRAMDIQAGQAANVPSIYIGKKQDAPPGAVTVTDNLLQAANYILTCAK